MTLLAHDVVIHAIGDVQVTPNGNRYVECQSSFGQITVWLPPRTSPVLQALHHHPLPVRVTIECLEDREKPGQYWVMENAAVTIHGEAAPAT